MPTARIALLVLVLSITGAGQAQGIAQFLLWSDEAMRTGDHYGASRYLAEALQQDPGRMELQWKYAEACRLSNQYPQAAEAYAKVYRKDQGRLHPEGLRWLGEMQLCAGQLDEAQKTWLKVKQKEKDKRSVTAQRADNAAAGIALTRELMAAPPVAQVQHLPEPVNTYDSEFGARTGPDEQLYFTSLRGELKDDEVVKDTGTYHAGIWRTSNMGDRWIAPVIVQAPEQGIGYANPAWSADGQVQYRSNCPAGGPCRIQMNDGGTGWQDVPGLGAEMSTQPHVVTRDGRASLLFTSDRAGGPGGLDIWMAELTANGATDPRPLPPPVNTPGNESCPYYEPVTRTLYFSSDFLPGFGGYDNFSSADSAGSFATPRNLGHPLNSHANDLYPVLNAATGDGYFTSNRIGSLAKKGATCCNDLYAFTLPNAGHVAPDTVKKDTVLTVAQKRITSLREKLPIRLYFHNDEPGPRSWDTTTTLTYEQTYRAYKALVPDYHRAWRANTTGIAAIDGFFREKVDHGFDQLNDFIALLKQALEEGQRIELQVRGFASPLAKSDYNANLSLRRISSMVNYLQVVDGGALRPFLRSGALRIRKSPFGEDQSASGISDRLEDLQGSVYSVGASLERRIEIEQVMLAQETGATIEPGSDPITNVYNVLTNSITQDIGTLEQLQHRNAVFLVRNTGGTPMHLLRARVQCDCVSVELPEQPVPPHGTQLVTVHFNGHAPEGRLERYIDVDTDGEPATLRLIVTGHLTPLR